jgi:retron-type reverse transcriptase
LNFLNQALVVLIPKKDNPKYVSDFRPIRLTHSFAKIITKLLANRLAPELDELIFMNQTTFIQKRCLHDNFIYVQKVIKDLHKKKKPSLFIKLDIFKAFDTINWSYLLYIVNHLGFTQKWRNWISSLWCTTSSAFLVNGIPDKKFFHCKGVRQGDPLSPMIFLLAMELLHILFRKAQDAELLGCLSRECDTFRVSLYADDVAIFINPSEKEFNVVLEILSDFDEASDLFTNMGKTECFPIQCEG